MSSVQWIDIAIDILTLRQVEESVGGVRRSVVRSRARHGLTKNVSQDHRQQ